MLTEQDGTAGLFTAGTTAVVAGVGVAVVAALGAPEAASIGHVSVFVGMALSLAGLLAGRPAARDVRVPPTEVRRDAHR